MNEQIKVETVVCIICKTWTSDAINRVCVACREKADARQFKLLQESEQFARDYGCGGCE